MLAVSAKTAFFDTGMNSDLFHVVVENTHSSEIKTHPYFPAAELPRGRIIRAGNLNMAVTVHLADAFFKAWEKRIRQRLQKRAFISKTAFDLLLGRAVNALVGNLPLPVQQEVVLFRQAGKHPAFQRIGFDILHRAFHLALVVRAIWLCRHHDRIVISTKLPQFRHNFRIVKVRFGDRSFQIIRHARQSHTAKITETVFQHPDEILRILMVYRFAVGLAGIAQNNPEYPGLAPYSIFPKNRSPAAKINLGFFAWKFFEAAHWIDMAGLLAADEALDGIVTA